MAHEFEGKVIKRMSKDTKETKKGGTFTIGGIVIETMGEFPKKIFFKVFKEEVIDYYLNNINLNQSVNVSFNAESREWEEKWYTDLVAWRIKPLTSSAEGDTSKKNEPTENGNTNVEPESEEKDDLPF